MHNVIDLFGSSPWKKRAVKIVWQGQEITQDRAEEIIRDKQSRSAICASAAAHHIARAERMSETSARLDREIDALEDLVRDAQDEKRGAA